MEFVVFEGSQGFVFFAEVGVEGPAVRVLGQAGLVEH